MRYILAVIILAASASAACGQTPYPLWTTARPVPKAAEISLLKNVRFSVVKQRVPEADGYNWLHGVAIAWHKDLLYVSFGHNQGSENTATEVANGRVSRDEGHSWGPLFSIDKGAENLAVSHGVFLSRTERLWAFQGSFFGRMNKIHTRAYLLDEESERWEPRGIVAESGFWPMQAPQRMKDGNWIMAGISVHGTIGGPDDPAAVAVSHGEDLTTWDVIAVPKPKDMIMWGESSVIVEEDEIVLIARYRNPVALVSVSTDCGRSWSKIRESNLPMTASKPYTGVLSTGQRFLIGTTTADSGNRRRPLTIAVSRPGEKCLSRIFRIRDDVYDGPGESKSGCSLAYPYAVERDGKLYVVYSNDGGRGGNRNSAELAVIPITELAISR